MLLIGSLAIAVMPPAAVAQPTYLIPGIKAGFTLGEAGHFFAGIEVSVSHWYGDGGTVGGLVAVDLHPGYAQFWLNGQTDMHSAESRWAPGCGMILEPDQLRGMPSSHLISLLVRLRGAHSFTIQATPRCKPRLVDRSRSQFVCTVPNFLSTFRML